MDQNKILKIQQMKCIPEKQDKTSDERRSQRKGHLRIKTFLLLRGTIVSRTEYCL